MNWSDVLPWRLALRQRYWERRYAMRAMRKHGYTYKAIGEKFGISVQGVSTNLAKCERERRFAQARRLPYPLLSPVERYQAAGILADIARHLGRQ